MMVSTSCRLSEISTLSLMVPGPTSTVATSFDVGCRSVQVNHCNEESTYCFPQPHTCSMALISGWMCGRQTTSWPHERIMSLTLYLSYSQFCLGVWQVVSVNGTLLHSSHLTSPTLWVPVVGQRFSFVNWLWYDDCPSPAPRLSELWRQAAEE